HRIDVEGWVRLDAQFTADGSRLVVLIEQEHSGRLPELWGIEVWDAASWQRLAELDPSGLRPGLLGGRGRWLIELLDGTNEVGTVRLDGLERRTYLVPDGAGGVYGYSADMDLEGKSLSATLHSGGIAVWDMGARESRRTLRGHRRGFDPIGVEFSPDGRWLASLGYRTGPPFVLKQFRDNVLGNDVAQADQFEGVLFDPRTGARQARLSGQSVPVFSGDSRRMVTIGQGETITVWELPQ